MKSCSFREYVNAVLKTAVYERGEDLPCVVAYADALPGCITQAETFEEARDMLIDAIETWILSALKDGEDLPPVNECIHTPGHWMALLYGKATGSDLRIGHPCCFVNCVGLTPSCPRRFNRGSLAFVSLTLTCSGYFPVALTPMLTTTAFDRSSLEWFGTCSWKPIPKDLPSSPVQLVHIWSAHSEPPFLAPAAHSK